MKIGVLGLILSLMICGCGAGRPNQNPSDDLLKPGSSDIKESFDISLNVKYNRFVKSEGNPDCIQAERNFVESIRANDSTRFSRYHIEGSEIQNGVKVGEYDSTTKGIILRITSLGPNSPTLYNRYQVISGNLYSSAGTSVTTASLSDPSFGCTVVYNVDLTINRLP